MCVTPPQSPEFNIEWTRNYGSNIYKLPSGNIETISSPAWDGTIDLLKRVSPDTDIVATPALTTTLELENEMNSVIERVIIERVEQVQAMSISQQVGNKAIVLLGTVWLRDDDMPGITDSALQIQGKNIRKVASRSTLMNLPSEYTDAFTSERLNIPIGKNQDIMPVLCLDLAHVSYDSEPKPSTLLVQSYWSAPTGFMSVAHDYDKYFKGTMRHAIECGFSNNPSVKDIIVIDGSSPTDPRTGQVILPVSCHARRI